MHAVERKGVHAGAVVAARAARNRQCRKREGGVDTHRRRSACVSERRFDAQRFWLTEPISTRLKSVNSWFGSSFVKKSATFMCVEM